MDQTELPLSPYSVLDLTRVRGGPAAVRQLADWGARVIRIEATASMNSEDGYTGRRHGSDFQNLHRNKRSLTLDLKSDDGFEVFRRLAENADVVVENFRPRVKHRLGIDYESLAALNPGLILASISGFGQDGPYADRPGVDQIAQGMGGLMAVTGFPGDGPVRAGTAIADLTGGLFLSYGILLALIERERTGEGQWVQTSLLEAMIAMMDFQAARFLVEGEVPAQAGNHHPTGGATNMFATSDGHINIAAGQAQIWPRLCAALELPDMEHDPDFADRQARLKNRDRLVEAISERTRTGTSAEWIEKLNHAGVPCGPVYRMDEVFADPQVEHLGIAAAVDHPILGRMRLVGQPLHLSRTPYAMRSATPEQGEHTDEVLSELGYDAATIADFHKRNVV